MGVLSWLGNGVRSLGRKAGRAASGIASIGTKALRGFNSIGGKLNKFSHSTFANAALDALDISGIPIISQIAGGIRTARDVSDSVLKATNRAEKIVGQGQKLASRVRQQIGPMAIAPAMAIQQPPMQSQPAPQKPPSIQKASSSPATVTPATNSILSGLLS